MTTLDIILRVLEDALWSGVAAAGFGMLFNVPRRWLWICMLLGAAGHGTRRLLEIGGLSIEIGTFVGALIVGFAGYFVARRLRAPQTIFTITGAIPLVPGVFAFRTMIGLLQVTTAAPEAVQALLAEASVNAIRTAVILAAIAIGIAFPSLWFDRQRPVV